MSKGNSKKKTAKKSVKNAARRSAKRDVVVVEAAKPFYEGASLGNTKAELLWLYEQLQRLGIRSIGDLENLIAKSE